MPRFVNLLFQGGGVKGLSYAGALSRMPEDIQVRAVGGTSAGAITAALIASGHDPRNLRKTLESLDLTSLLPGEAVATLAEIRALVAEVIKLSKEASVEGLPLWKISTFLLSNRKSLKTHFAKLVKDYGIFASDTLESWLKKQTGGVKFDNIKVEDLRIVAADVSTGEYKVYSRGDTGNEYVHVAATASASIPFFFEPKLDGGFLVDGGMLSNFPLFLFEREAFPTVGFRLFYFSPPSGRVRSLGDFIGHLLNSMMDAHDKLRPRPEHFCEQSVLLPDDISAIDFDLEDDEKEELFELGVAAGARVDWNRFSSATPHYIGLDPKPDKVLTDVLVNAQRCGDSLNDPNLWPEKLESDVHYRVTIEPDLSVSYETIQSYVVGGKRVLMGAQAFLEFEKDRLDLARTSIADLEWKFFETTGGRPHPLPRFPVKNEVLHRQFLYLFVPPISEADGKRTFLNKWRIPLEMAATLGRGNSDFVSYTRSARANQHHLMLQMEVLIADSVGQVVLQQTKGGLNLIRDAQGISLNGLPYSRWHGAFKAPILLNGTAEYRFELRHT